MNFPSLSLLCHPVRIRVNRTASVRKNIIITLSKSWKEAKTASTRTQTLNARSVSCHDDYCPVHFKFFGDNHRNFAYLFLSSLNPTRQSIYGRPFIALHLISAWKIRLYFSTDRNDSRDREKEREREIQMEGGGGRGGGRKTRPGLVYNLRSDIGTQSFAYVNKCRKRHRDWTGHGQAMQINRGSNTSH